MSRGMSQKRVVKAWCFLIQMRPLDVEGAEAMKTGGNAVNAVKPIPTVQPEPEVEQPGGGNAVQNTGSGQVIHNQL